MLTSDASALVAAAPAPGRGQGITADAVMVVADPGFAVCPDTASDNRYVEAGARPDAELAWRQQQALTRKLIELGLPVISFPPLAGASDGVFPNNAFAPHRGRLVVGAMRHPVRQRETQRSDVRRFFAGMGMMVQPLGDDGVVAELTGSLVMDHARRIGFCGLSERANAAGAQAMHRAFDLRATLTFDLADGEYHTNVVLSILAGRAAVVCPAGVRGQQLDQALDALYPGAVLRLTVEEKNHFAANCLAVTPSDVVISRRARSHLSAESIAFFEANGFTLHDLDVSELERAGGSVRCMIAEVFYQSDD